MAGIGGRGVGALRVLGKLAAVVTPALLLATCSEEGNPGPRSISNMSSDTLSGDDLLATRADSGSSPADIASPVATPPTLPALEKLTPQLEVLKDFDCPDDRFVGDAEFRAADNALCWSCTTFAGKGGLRCRPLEGTGGQEQQLAFRPDQIALIDNTSIATTWHLPQGPDGERWGAARVNMETGAKTFYAFPEQHSDTSASYWPSFAKGIAVANNDLYVVAGNIFFGDMAPKNIPGQVFQFSLAGQGTAETEMQSLGSNPTTLNAFTNADGKTMMLVANTGDFSQWGKSDAGSIASISLPEKQPSLFQIIRGGMGLTGEGVITGNTWVLPSADNSGQICAYDLASKGDPTCTPKITEGGLHLMGALSTFQHDGITYLMGCDHNTTLCSVWKSSALAQAPLISFPVESPAGQGVVKIIPRPQTDTTSTGYAPMILAVGAQHRRLWFTESGE
jgi:hypothetical protein